MSSGTAAHRARSRDEVTGRLDRLLGAPAAPSRGAPATASPVRVGRWSVPASAGVALLVVASVVGVAAAVRTAEATPGVPVPARTTATSDAPAISENTTGTPPSTSPPTDAPAEADDATGEVVVHVVGAVGAPGLVTLPGGARVADALAAVGGAAGDADLTRVNLARLLVDGEQVVVPRPGDPLPAAAPSGATEGAAGPSAPVDLNTATLDQLDELPGIGPVLAQRILDWRTEHGAFTSVGELAEVSGIGDAVLADLEPLVTV